MLILKENNVSATDVSEIVSSHMLDIGVLWAKLYKKDGKVFINTLVKFQSMWTVAAWVVWAYKYYGIFEDCKLTGKDFTAYCNKLDIDEKFKRVVSELLLIMYFIKTNFDNQLLNLKQ